MPLDLTATAQANSGTRQAEARAAGLEPGHEIALRAHIAASSFTTNATADKIIAFDDLAEIAHKRAVCIHQAAGDVAIGLAAFAKGSWSTRREAFEDLWAYGRSLVYGVVNSGNLGAESYGAWCLALSDPEASAPQALGVFPGDTAQRYTTASGGVSAAQASDEATAWSDRADLSVSKLGALAAAAPEAEWPSVVCNDASYFEAVRAGSLPVSSLKEVRVREDYLHRLDDAAGRRALGEDLPDGILDPELEAWRRVVNGWVPAHGIELVGMA